jgi:hypothetical protein
VREALTSWAMLKISRSNDMIRQNLEASKPPLVLSRAPASSSTSRSFDRLSSDGLFPLNKFVSTITSPVKSMSVHHKCMGSFLKAGDLEK